MYGAYVKDNVLYIIYTNQNSNLTYITTIDLSTLNTLSTYNIGNYIPGIINVNNKLYCLSTHNNLCETNLYNLKHIELLTYGSICAYGNSILYYSNECFTEIKPYKIATSYATKGTKIYLPNTSAPITENLQIIDNDYEVTESGEVKIKLYE